MAITAGTKLGPYEIVSPLGAGGMGEVYRARDTRLDRTVAIKILAAHLSSSPELKQRFEREARTISSLSHPHICHLYDIGAQDGTDYLVMEFLEGETLAERLRKGPLPLNELLKIGMEVAEALQVAHRADIIHRDLKPGNIMLTKSGAKLMDFGLAKPATLGAAASGTAPLLSAARTSSGPSPLSPLTSAGSIVGTIQYMSPEQIEGKEADARSDIFAFGAVLYEMATGKRAFEGKSQLTVASAILEKDPEPISVVKPLTPPGFEHVVQRAMEKSPEERWQSASDIRGELRWVAESAKQTQLPTRAVKARGWHLAWIAALALTAVMASVAVLFFVGTSGGPAYPIRSFIPAPENVTYVFEGDNGGPPVLSPDGRQLAYVASEANGVQQIYLRPLGALEAHALAGTENAWAPFWSPDGRKLGFFAEAKLKVISIQGGSPVSIADAPNARGGSWSSNGTIIFAPNFRSLLYSVPSSGGTPVAVTKMDEAKHTSHRWPFFLPDGKHFLYLAVNHDSPRNENDGIYFASLDGKQNVKLKTAFTNPEYSGGSLLFVRDGNLIAQSLDASSGKLSDEDQVAIHDVAEDISTWRGVFAVSGNGVLAYSTAGAEAQEQLAWFDRSGKELGLVGDKFSGLVGLALGSSPFRLSPNGDRVAIAIQGTTSDVWVVDVMRGVRTRLTFGPTGNNNPVWSPDGKWIAYQTISKNGNIIGRRPAGGGPEETLIPETGIFTAPTDWSRDGEYLLFDRGAIGTNQEVWAWPLHGDRKPFPLATPGAFFMLGGHMAPDGKWVAYQSNESGRMEVYVVAFRGGTGKWQVSTAGGASPTWRSDGKEIFYFSLSGMLMAVPVAEQAGELKLGTPQPLFHANNVTYGGFGGVYDVAAGGQKFLLTSSDKHTSPPITLVVNWNAELKK